MVCFDRIDGLLSTARFPLRSPRRSRANPLGKCCALRSFRHAFSSPSSKLDSTSTQNPTSFQDVNSRFIGQNFRSIFLTPRAQELSEGLGEYLIHRYRDEESNLRTQLHRIIKRAHLTPWPKAFQNLRASRATDLVMRHPLHVVSQWTGHSIETMRKFYLQVTDEHREAALKIKPHLPPAAIENSSAQPTGEAKQNPKQSMRDTPRNTAQEKSQTPVFSAFGFDCLELSGPEVAAEGLELRLSFKGKTYILSPAGDSLGIFPSNQ